MYFYFRKILHVSKTRSRTAALRHRTGKNTKKSEESKECCINNYGRAERKDANHSKKRGRRETLEANDYGNFWRPTIQEEYSAMRQPTIEANNFELKSVLITMV